jgi:hypothetical protein
METENDNSVEIEVKVRTLDGRTNTFTEVIATRAKLTKADAGLTEGPKGGCILISIDPGSLPNYAGAKVLVSMHPRSYGADLNAN